jgi:hypothetical protein
VYTTRGPLMLRRAPVALLALLLPLTAARTAAAQDPFEIQVYDPETNDPGQFGLELHSNAATSGDTTLHETLEASFGVLPSLEIGAYLQTALRPAARFEYAGAKARVKWRLPVPESFPIQIALNAELSLLPKIYDPAELGGELRPILEWHPGDFVLDLNPILSFDWRGPDAGIPHFEPAVSARYEIGGLIALGLEYYGGIGPLSHVPQIREQHHYLFEMVQVIAWKEYEIHAGVGEGLTAASNGLVLMSLLGHQF